ncbi:hypothetical protein SAMN05216417_1081 [Nitrosospira multiformis]|uniref:TauD/TfdA-like domain-containing protein n=1 Tax=Nitrosospira multiformis TaxID=1231 RepID=A0A1I7HAI5_9PROT|nr:hypothetical protein SAMN05216417_1081 [Nitrosospira multiformis]
MNAHTYAEDYVGEQPEIDLNRLHSRGWVSFNLPVSSESIFREKLSAIAAKIGTPAGTRSSKSLCDTLVPITSSKAKTGSLSRIYDVGEFPLHVDTAHWPTPCHYIVLACINPGSARRGTLLMDTQNFFLEYGQAELLYTTPFRVRNGRKSFFSTIVSKGRSFVRIDPGCMTPTSLNGAKALDLFSRQNVLRYVVMCPR